MDLNTKTPELPSDFLSPDEPQPALDTSVLEGQIYTVLKNRIERAKEAQESWWKAGKALRAFMEGDQWAADLSALMSPENGWIRKTVNKMKSLRTGIVAQVAFDSPKVVALPLRRTPEFIGKATVASTLLNHSIRESNVQLQQKKAALDALAFGAGFMHLCTDPERGGIPGLQWRSSEDVAVDPDAKTIEDAKWVAYRRTVNVFHARKEFDEPSLVSDQQTMKGKGVEVKGIAPAPEDETLELWEVYCRADAIGFADADENNKKNAVKDGVSKDSPAMLRYVTEAGNRIFQISLTHNKILSDKPWPFILDHDLLPIWPVYLEESTHTILPESVLKPAMGLQRALNTVYSFIVTQAYTISKIKFSADKQVVQDEKVMKGLKSAEVGSILPVDGGMLGIQQINMGQLSIAMIQLLNQTDQFFNQITGYMEMFGGMEGARSATEAGIREERAQTNTSTMRQAFENGLKRLIRGMWQVAMSTMSAGKVADIVGREEMGYVNAQTGAIDDDDNLNTTPINWPYDNAKPAEIRRENFVAYVINSTRKPNPRQEAQDLRGIMQDLMGLIGSYTQQGYRIAPTRMARKTNYVFSRILQAMGVIDFKQMEILPEDLSIDDRLMPRGPTEEQMLAKFEGQQQEQAQEAAVGNTEAVAEALAQQTGMPLEVAQTMLAGLSPEQVTALTQVIEQGGSMQGGPQMPMQPQGV